MAEAKAGPRAFAPSETFSGSTIQEVETFLSAKGINSLEDFLPRLPVETRANFVLMRQSSSLQPTKDPLRPRAILFGGDGKLVFAFNGTSGSLELMESPSAGEDFHFERINFGAGRPPSIQVNCQGCHGGHPLWGQYRSWAGMYGGDQELVPTGSPEEKDYFAFLKASAGDSIYKNLIFKCGTYYNGGIVPGFVPSAGSGSDLPACMELDQIVNGKPFADRLRRRLDQPGEGMDELMDRQNVARLFARAQSSIKAPPLAYAYAANSFGCLGARIYDYNSGDPEALTRMREGLRDVAPPIEARIAALASAKGSAESTTQGQLLNLLGIDVGGDLRVDIRHDSKAPLGSDCALRGAYSPNPYCNGGSYGYDAYSDGSDMGANLLGYLMLRNIYGQDTAVRDLLKAGLQSTEIYFRSLVPGSGDGYARRDDVLRYLEPVLADLENPVSDPSQLPKYIQDYPFTQLLRWGNGEGICRALLTKSLP